MRIVHIFIAASIILSVCYDGFGCQEKSYTIRISVFEIPPIQTMTNTISDKNGAIVGTTIGGDVTMRFPAEPVFIQTDLGPGATEKEYKKMLYDRKYLEENCLPGGVFWSSSGSYSISQAERDLGMESSRKEYHEPPIAPSGENHYVGRGEYWLEILPVSADSGEAVLKLKFTGKIKPAENDAGRDKILFDQDIHISLGKTALVGFPQFNMEAKRDIPRGAVYILAICIERQGF